MLVLAAVRGGVVLKGRPAAGFVGIFLHNHPQPLASFCRLGTVSDHTLAFARLLSRRERGISNGLLRSLTHGSIGSQLRESVVSMRGGH